MTLNTDTQTQSGYIWPVHCRIYASNTCFILSIYKYHTNKYMLEINIHRFYETDAEYHSLIL